MAKEFNVPTVVFPSGGTPATPASGPQQRRLPTAPFQPPRSSNPGLPFLSFDVNSAAASTSFSAAPQFPSTIGGGAGFDDEPPLLEELGINTKQIYHKTLSILNPLRINHYLHEDADLSGPFLFLMAFGLFQLLAGKLHFGIILGWVTMASMFLYVVFNMLAGKNGNLDMYKCFESDWVLYAADCDVVGGFSVSSARGNGDHGDYGAVRDLVDACLYWIGCGAR